MLLDHNTLHFINEFVHLIMFCLSDQTSKSAAAGGSTLSQQSRKELSLDAQPKTQTDSVKHGVTPGSTADVAATKMGRVSRSSSKSSRSSSRSMSRSRSSSRSSRHESVSKNEVSKEKKARNSLSPKSSNKKMVQVWFFLPFVFFF